MTITSEKDIRCLREMTFYGKEVDGLLDENMKMLTLRKPNEKYGFIKGEVIEANCPDSGTRVNLVVIDNIKKPLNEFSDAELLLDGYEGVEYAVEDLKKYYGDVTEESEMQGVYTITEELFESLPPEAQEFLLQWGGVNAILDVDQMYRNIFWPAWCRWVAAKGGGGSEWREFLMVNDLVYYDETTDTHDGLSAEEMEVIAGDKTHPLFGQAVMMNDFS